MHARNSLFIYFILFFILFFILLFILYYKSNTNFFI